MSKAAPGPRARRAMVAVAVVVVVAAIHVFRLGSRLPREWRGLYAGYASDALLPFAFYYLLALREDWWPPLSSPAVKALLVFAPAALAETLQGLAIPALGVTFDPLDYLMYALGALAALLIDTQVLARSLPSRAAKTR